MNKERIWELAEEVYPWARETRRALHRIPEPGFQEFETQKFIRRALDGMGIPCQTERTWVIGLIDSGRPGPVIGFRADMDALPVCEPEGLPFRSQNEGYMHACGHDAHMAVLLGTARALVQARGEWCGQVKLLFQPAEETDGGALPMVKAGVLESPRPEAVYGLHVMPRLPLGTVETREGTLNASTGSVRLVVHGRGGHGAYPESARDAIVGAAEIICALQTVISRNLSPLETAVLSFGQIYGGNANNVICDTVEVSGTLRTANRATREFLKKRIREVAEGVAAALDLRCEVEMEDGYAALVNDPAAARRVLRLAGELVGEENALVKELPSMGGEDFSYFIEDIPGAFFHIGCSPRDREGAPLHSAGFMLEEEALKVGMAMEIGLVCFERGGGGFAPETGTKE